MTHPLFGPNSVSQGLKGHTLVVTESQGSLAEKVVDYCEKELGLQIKRVSAKVHDQTMAQVHALTFFVARGLARLNKVDPAFTTPSYKLVADLIKLDQTRSNDLFVTIQKGNPYAHKIRQEFLNMLQTIDKELQDE
jgi:prephenate dehydrogenase